ncbi:NAD-dependent succinate-semialdehyde dehydrogenase [Celeribacter litoreus]|uniref:NAD-dependent succinate-semialdehyde dehydrogenase n=1 Tax=Celeribacter litoreus TaxID=2876714 RepID=UPI001CCCBB78|nr:NAD-dependent succinate-semialdehyde dehydrogenase [Celeribacter litoreus]MCA0043361.1 NAD-dependent succinate-semialdehyde dehydrogenase [Celeribacter litoreus]
MTEDVASHSYTYPAVGLLIDGEWIYDREPCHQVKNPADDRILGPVPGATSEDYDRALAAAAKGFEIWRKVPPQDRAALLKRVAVLMRERAAEIAPAITLEHGKPLADAEAEVVRSSSFLEWDAEQLLRDYGRIVPTPHPNYQFVVREPIGPVAAFTPWNVPVSAAGRKLAGSLAAGCSVIIKPASQTPASTCLLAQCFIDAGLPEGVLQVIHGKSSEVSERLILSSVIRMVTLTGSVEVGKQLTRLAAEGVKPVLMELGGHAPVLIGPDVNPATVADLATFGKFRMAGQLCVSPSRFLIHESVYSDFVSEFAARAQALKVGGGFEEGAEVGPLVNSRRIDTMERLVADATARGAKVLSGGARVGNSGCFFAPTVLGDVPLDAAVLHEEPFGPLAPCLPVSDMDEALKIANDIEVGLAGYVFTNDMVLADRLTNALECGSVALNQFTSPGADAPFGGHKESGIGVEGGAESLHSYTVSKTISERRVRV